MTDLRLTGRNEHQGIVRATWRHPFGLVANVRGMFNGNWVAARATVNGQPVRTRSLRAIRCGTSMRRSGSCAA